MSVVLGNPMALSGKKKPALQFTYTGVYTEREDGVVELRSSGTLVFLNPAKIDVFCVGGGGAGGVRRSDSTDVSSAAGGGGGGLTATLKNVPVTGTIDVLIGAGSTEPSTTETLKKGGTTTFGTILSAEGGNSGLKTTVNYSSGSLQGADGGSGGGGGVNSNSSYGSGGYDGNDGEHGYPTSMLGGNGQGSTTREFGEPGAKLYAGGGGGGRFMSSQTPVVSAGGDGGGGAGGWVGMSSSSIRHAMDGADNTGGGGGGYAEYRTSGGTRWAAENGSGGSGIVCLRASAG